MARTPRIDIATFAEGLAVVLKILPLVLVASTASIAEVRAAPAVIVTNPYVGQPQASPTQPTAPQLDASADSTNTPNAVAALPYPTTASKTVTNPYVSTPSDWNPPPVENPFSPAASLSSHQEPLRWGPVSRWRTPGRMDSDEKIAKNADSDDDLFSLMPLEVPLRLAPTGAAEADALSEAFGVEKTQENINAPAGDGLPPNPTEWVTDEIKQPTWLQMGDKKDEAVAGNTERWHSPEAGQFDPFEGSSFEEPPAKELSFREPATGAAFVSDDTGPAGSPPLFRTPTPKPHQNPQAIAQALIPGTTSPTQPVTTHNALQLAQQQAESAKSLGDFETVVGKCDTFLAAQPPKELALEARRLCAWAHNRIGELLAENAQPEEAMREFELALRHDQTNSLALHNRAIHLAQQGEYEQALHDFSAAIQHNPGLKIAYRNRAELLSALGQSQAAIKDYTSALQHQPDDEQLLVLRAHTLHRVREYSQAMADFNAALRLVPTNPDAYTGRGNLHAEMGHYQSAIEDYRQALLADANWGDAYRSLAWLLATCPDPKYQNPRRAMVAARQAAKFGSERDPFVLEALAAASASAGQFRAAAELQQRALAVAPQLGPQLGTQLVASRMKHRLALYRQDQPFLSGQPSLSGQSTGVQQAGYEE